MVMVTLLHDANLAAADKRARVLAGEADVAALERVKTLQGGLLAVQAEDVENVPAIGHELAECLLDLSRRQHRIRIVDVNAIVGCVEAADAGAHGCRFELFQIRALLMELKAADLLLIRVPHDALALEICSPLVIGALLVHPGGG